MRRTKVEDHSRVLVYGALGGPLPRLGVIAAAVLVAVVMLHRDARVQALAMLGALVLAPVLLLADIWHSPQLHVVHRHPLYAMAGAVVALGAVAVAAWVVAKRPALFAGAWAARSPISVSSVIITPVEIVWPVYVTT